MEINREKEDLLPCALANQLFKLVGKDVYWRKNLGRKAGSDHNGYQEIDITLDGKKRKFQARRIAYLLTHGQWPKHQLTKAKNV